MPNNKFTKISLVTLLMLMSACANSPKEKPVENKKTLTFTPKETKYVKDHTTVVLIDDGVKKEDIKKIVPHGDHWHIFTKDGRELITYSDPNKASLKTAVVSSVVDQITDSVTNGSEIKSIFKHDDHWHVILADGRELITYKDPSTTQTIKDIEKHSVPTVSETQLNNLDIKTSYLHNDHWHIITQDGKEYISHQDPSNKHNISDLKDIKPVKVETNTKLFERVVDHGDHVHAWFNGKEYFLAKTDYEKAIKANKFEPKDNNNDIPDNDQTKYTLQDKINYIATYYDLDKNTIQVEGEYLSFPHLDHSHHIKISDIKIPKSSNDIEADFEKELEALAKLTKTDIHSIIIEDGYMKISHGDHTHDYKIKSPGWNLYLKNRIPDIDSVYIEGDLDRNAVTNKALEIRNIARIKYKDNARQLKRIESALDKFLKDLAWSTNSTKAYITALDNFNKKYVEKTEKVNIETEVVLSYKALLNNVQNALKNLDKTADNYQEMLVKLKNLEQSISYHSSDLTQLSQDWVKLKQELKLQNLEANDLKAETKYDQIYQILRNMKDDAKKVALLNKFYEIKNDDLDALKEFEKLINSDKVEIVDNNKEILIKYIDSNKNNVKLSQELRNELNSKVLKDLSYKELEALKTKIKLAFSKHDEQENKYSKLAVSVILEIKDKLNKMIDQEFMNNLKESLEMLEEDLKNGQDKQSVYNELASMNKHLDEILLKQIKTEEVDKEKELDQEAKEENKKDLVNPEINKEEFSEILKFLNSNRRFEMDNSSEKAKLLNEIDDIDNRFKNNVATADDFTRIKKIKEIVEPLIDKNSSNNNNSNDWGW